MFNQLPSVSSVALILQLMKNLKKRKGFKNRHLEKLPLKGAILRILVNDVDDEHIHICKWIPFDKENYDEGNIPTVGYLGTAATIINEPLNIGFNVWEQNDDEFIYYSIIT